MLSSSATPESSSSTSVVAVEQSAEPVKVRFDDQCVLIPDPVTPSRMPRLVKKSYSLPLWKKRSSPVIGSSSPKLGADDGTPTSPEENQLVFTLSIPSFAKARSPTRGEHRHHPLVPCIVDHMHPHTRRSRRPSLPTPYNPGLVTIPLRQCCSDCYPITEECLQEGETWQEKFTRGARRRRSASVDTGSTRSHNHRRKVSETLPGFDAMVNVDEVDKIHGSRHTAIVSPEPPSLDTLVIDQEEEMSLLPSLSRQRDPGSLEGKLVSDSAPPLITEEKDDQMILSPSAPNLFAMEICDALNSTPEQKESHIGLGLATPEPTFSPPSLFNSTSSQHTSSQHTSSPELLRTPPSQPIPIPHSNHTKYISSPESVPTTFSPELSFSPSPPRHAPPSPEISRSPTTGKRRPHLHMPTAGSFIKASVEMLKGVSSIGGPMAV